MQYYILLFYTYADSYYLWLYNADISFVFGINSIIQYVTGKALGGFTTVILLQLFSSSIIMICLGIIGYYIAQIYEEIKGRPKFIISEKC